MAYDEALTTRYREKLAGLDGISEKRMMGGMCFFLNGHMIGGADRAKTGERRLMFRVGKENTARADALPLGEKMIMGSRVMSGMYFVDADKADDDMLRGWLELALEHARALPPK